MSNFKCDFCHKEESTNRRIMIPTRQGKYKMKFYISICFGCMDTIAKTAAGKEKKDIKIKSKIGFNMPETDDERKQIIQISL